jgi:hypothetical protein
MKQIYETGIPPSYPPLKELSMRLSEYIKTGEPWAGKIKFEAYGRVADIVLPRRADRQIVVILRKI